jgi:hypothetical protein
VLVYRVENEAGEGPYWTGDADGVGMESQDAPAIHPSPYYDGMGLHFTPGMLCGFVSVAQFKRWFYRKEWRRGLAALGYKLMVYEVPPDMVVRGHRQVAFRPAQVRPVTVRDLVEV